MVLHTRRRAFRLQGEGVLTRLNRVEGLIKELKDGKLPSKKAIARELVQYHRLLQALWLWGLKKQ